MGVTVIVMLGPPVSGTELQWPAKDVLSHSVELVAGFEQNSRTTDGQQSPGHTSSWCVGKRRIHERPGVGAACVLRRWRRDRSTQRHDVYLPRARQARRMGLTRCGPPQAIVRRGRHGNLRRPPSGPVRPAGCRKLVRRGCHQLPQGGADGANPRPDRRSHHPVRARRVPGPAGRAHRPSRPVTAGTQG